MPTIHTGSPCIETLGSREKASMPRLFLAIFCFLFATGGKQKPRRCGKGGCEAFGPDDPRLAPPRAMSMIFECAANTGLLIPCLCRDEREVLWGRPSKMLLHATRGFYSPRAVKCIVRYIIIIALCLPKVNTRGIFL